MANDASNKTTTGKTETHRTPRRIFQRPVGLLRRGEYEVVQALQLSEGGMLFQSEHSFAVSEAIVVSIVIPGGACIVTRAEIIYERPRTAEGSRQFGVKFATLSLHLRRHIRNYVTAKTQAEAEAERLETERARRAN